MPAICLSDPPPRHSVVNNITGPWPTVAEHRHYWVFVDLIWFSALIVDAAIYACTYSSRPRSKRAIQPLHFRPPPVSIPPSFPPTRFIQSSGWTLSPLTLLNHRAHKHAAAEQNHADDMKNRSRVLHVHQYLPSGERHIFFFFFLSQNQGNLRRQTAIVPGSCRAPVSDCITSDRHPW